MKPIYKVLTTSLMILMLCPHLSFSQPYSFQGWVSYWNATSNPFAPINGVEVQLWDGPYQQGDCYSGYWNSNVSYYGIPFIDPGTYDLIPISNTSWGGGNACDALLTAKYSLGLVSFNWQQREAADVNCSGTINAGDATVIMRRFVLLTNMFCKPDWLFYEANQSSYQSSFSVTVSSTPPTYYYMHALCYGDVNGSYYHALCPTCKNTPSVHLTTAGEKHVKDGESFDLEIITKDSLVVGAMSLVIKIPTDKYEFNDVRLPETCDTCFYYNYDNGDLRIAWYNTDGALEDVNDVIVDLGLTAKDHKYYQSSEGIEITEESEIADTTGKAQTQIELSIRKVVIDIPDNDILMMNVYPNPANQNVEFSYKIPVDGEVSIVLYDALGHAVAQVVKGKQLADTYHTSFDVSRFPSGLYTYKIVFNDIVKTEKLVIIR